MPIREVADAAGIVWKVWDVAPTMTERFDAENPATSSETAERQRARSVRGRLPGPMTNGWLAIMAGTERRRIAPIPEGWSTMADAELLELIRTEAVITTPVRRSTE
jgi:hypothetical protein